MPTYQQLEQQLANDLIDAPRSLIKAPNITGMFPELQALIDSLPYFGDTDFHTAHRGTMANLLEVYLPNSAIAAEPNVAGFGYYNDFYYNGPCSGYQNAFYGGVSLTSAAANLAATVLSVNGNLNNGWWGNYGVTALTDAIRQTVGGPIDTGKLALDLSNNNIALRPALAASYLAVYSNGYGPTANALGALKNSGLIAQANTELVAAIASAQFTANINQAIAMGGDSTNAAVWFLFNLWITLKAVGNANVDAAIQQFQSAGLEVPAEAGPGSWWSGGYISWYLPLSGSDVVTAARGTINAALPEKEVSTTMNLGPPPGPPFVYTSYPTSANGYCWSLIAWGSLNWYKPPPSSCFGKGTGVLMADGSVKPIEKVQVDDQVRSSDGPKKVLLVESPSRANRTLYRPNGLDVYATVGHPFRTAQGSGPMRVAVDPWALIDSVPTMTEGGVGVLKPGTRLYGLGPSGLADVAVERLDGFEATPDSDEHIYDLILERSDGSASLYFVGGPDTFLAVDAESADPLYDPACTAGIVTAMELASSSCREHLSNPVTQLPGVLNTVRLDEVLPRARSAAWRVPAGKLARPQVPRMEFFTHEGAWDPHASMLEAYLVRHYARTLRREAATGWRSFPSPQGPGGQLSVVLHDIQLLGDLSVGVTAKLGVQLRLRGWNPLEDTVRELSVALGQAPAWHISVDEILDFGRIPTVAGPALLLGKVTLDGSPVGEFHATINEESLTGGTAEYFLFDPAGVVVGRIALEPRSDSGSDRTGEGQRAKAWTNHHATALAISLGKQIGNQIVSHLESRGG